MNRQGKRAIRWVVLLALALIGLVALQPVAAAGSVALRTTGDVAPAAYEHLITNIRLDPPTPNILTFNQNVNVTFDYVTNAATGVRIFARPMAGGELAPNYAAHGSILYSPGSGSGAGLFTITAGDVVVDRIRFQMWDANQNVLLYQVFLPVRYQYTGAAHRVTNIRLDPPTPNILTFNQNVDITFDYATTQPGGVRIFARPMAGTSTAPNYAAHGSGVYPVGSGSGTGNFTIVSGDVTVDRIRFQVYNADQSALLAELYIPVHYQFNGAPNRVTNIRLDPPTPNILAFNDDVNITFDYAATEPGGVRIFARPMALGTTAPNYAAHGSAIHPAGSGSGTGFFTITSGDITVDQVRFQVFNADQSALLAEYLIPVHYQYGYGTPLGRRIYMPMVLKP